MDEESNGDQVTNTSSDMEQDSSDATLPEDFFEKETARVNINVRSFRRLNHDPDGISAKAVLDGVVERGILADDSTIQIKAVTFESFTGCGKDEEVTIIEIIEGE